jgi:hypothetical protein
VRDRECLSQACRTGARDLPGQNESTALPELSRIVTQVTAELRAEGTTPGVFMSRRLGFRFAAFVLLAILSTSPASSNPFADLFNVAAQTPTTPASPEKDCLSRPGQSTADGQHWVYRIDGRRKCWFQAAEGTATSKKRNQHHAAKHRVAAPASETARHLDARAELLRSASAETSQPTPPTAELEVVDAASVIATRVAALAPPAPVADRASDQLTPDYRTLRQVDVETLLAASASDAVADSVPPAPPVAFSIADPGDDWPGFTANWLGMLLMALGLVSVLSSSRVLRGTVLLRKLK